ncbi:MAG TPA: DoxX family membrane protein [Candidatus Dormibacteraeota bacterium]|nr:DoxX family membrane protein [Candidatus Dormibacteraeota bacterium]
MRLPELWRSLYRVVVGVFWLYWASQKWGGVGWMKGIIQGAAAVNPIPGLHEFLAIVVAPNWYLAAVVQGIAETLVGLCLVLGLATRKAAAVGLLLALNLALVVAFEVSDPGFRWLYYLGVIVNAELIFSKPASLALGNYRSVPSWLRS